MPSLCMSSLCMQSEQVMRVKDIFSLISQSLATLGLEFELAWTPIEMNINQLHEFLT